MIENVSPEKAGKDSERKLDNDSEGRSPTASSAALRPEGPAAPNADQLQVP